MVPSAHEPDSNSDLRRRRYAEEGPAILNLRGAGMQGRGDSYRRQSRQASGLAQCVAWGEPIVIESVEARRMGTAPVCFNSSKWMAADEYGLVFFVHTETSGLGRRASGAGLRLLIFDLNNPSSPPQSHLLSFRAPISELKSPTLALSNGPMGTRFTLACVGVRAVGQSRSRDRICIASGLLSRSRFSAPPRLTFNAQMVLDAGLNQVANPSLFMDNEGYVHLVFEGREAGAWAIRYARARWLPAPRSWLWSMRTLFSTSEFEALNPSVAARWSDGRLVVVVAYKVKAPRPAPMVDEGVGVYVNVGTSAVMAGSGMGSTRPPVLSWSGFKFLDGMNVMGGVALGAPANPNAWDPSVWVSEDGPFRVGYHMRPAGGLISINTPTIPALVTNMQPEDRSSPWKEQTVEANGEFAMFVGVSGTSDEDLCVWESRLDNVPEPSRWSAAIGPPRAGSSADRDLLDPSASWNLSLKDESGRDLLLFPTGWITPDHVLVAWLYVDRQQDGRGDGPLDSPLTWPDASGEATVEITLLVGERSCR